MANLTNEMLDAVNTYIEVCKKDYFKWTSRCAKVNGDEILSDARKQMLNEFNDGITFKAGSK